MERAETRTYIVHVTDITEPSNTEQNGNLSPTSISGGRNPLNSGYWISYKLFIAAAQIIAAIVVLIMYRHEHPHALLLTWIIAFVFGCVATIPLLLWRFHYRNETSADDLDDAPNVFFALCIAFATLSTGPTSALDTKFKEGVEYFARGLDFFFAMEIVFGFFFFDYLSIPSDAPNYRRLYQGLVCSIWIGNVIPFILSFIIYYFLPCIISVLGFLRGATSESVNSLPTYKFKIKKHKHGSNTAEGGVVAAGTEHERVLSGKDAVCRICLANYADNDELRGLLCSHYFHKYCV